MEIFKHSLATLTGGSGAVAVLLTDGSFSPERRRRLLGGVTQTAPQFHGLCRWGLETRSAPLAGFRAVHVDRRGRPCSSTASSSACGPGRPSSASSAGSSEQVDKVICHQVGSGHRDTILKTLGIAAEKDFSTFPYLGNIGTVSLPLTAALAEDREFLRPGDRVGLPGHRQRAELPDARLEW